MSATLGNRGTGHNTQTTPTPRGLGTVNALPAFLQATRQFARKGFTIFRPAKSLSFSVTTTQSFASATAATIMSPEPPRHDRFSDGSNDHVEGAPGPPFRRAVRHHPRPDQAGLFVEREHS